MISSPIIQTITETENISKYVRILAPRQVSTNAQRSHGSGPSKESREL